jgi:myo-inositol-1(or 4)-monophosphatase
MDLAAYRDFIIELAEASGDFIRPFFANPDLSIETKSDKTPVTEADRGGEELLRRMISARYPDHGILGEELGAHNADAEFVWVLDPIDGTRSFASGCPLFGTLIALMKMNQPVLGAIHQPVLRQLLIGDGKHTTLNERPVRCRRTTRIEDATFLSTDLHSPAKYQNGVAFDRVLKQARLARTWGDCYGYLLVAGGWADAMCDPIMNPWDIAALVPVIRGAGGVITDWQGRDAVAGRSTVAAATPELHAALITALNK